MHKPIITLTTDFGSKDGYVAAMKGVILGINQDALVVDITHDVPPQGISSAAYVLGTTYAYYPPRSVHVAVVDPGVGTSRRALVLRTPRGIFVAPDNGLLTYVLRDQGVSPDSKAEFMAPISAPMPVGCQASSITNSKYWLENVSSTFHGRDIFAPVAAHLSLGEQPENMGEPVTEMTCLNIPDPGVKGGLVSGRVIYVDRFGNLVTNIKSQLLVNKAIVVEIKRRTISGLSRTYASTKGLAAILGSHGYLEIAKSNGSASKTLAAHTGEKVEVFIRH